MAIADGSGSAATASVGAPGEALRDTRMEAHGGGGAVTTARTNNVVDLLVDHRYNLKVMTVDDGQSHSVNSR